MAAQHQPSNGDLLKEIKVMQSFITKLDSRVENLEIWKISTDASTAAIEKYKSTERLARQEKTKMEIFQALLPFIVALTALVYALITYVGRTR